MDLSITGLNHKVAPVELREKLAIDAEAIPAALVELRRRSGASEMVILSTCNRVEIYAAHEGKAPPPDQTTALLAERHGVPAETLAPVLYHHRGADAVRHLFRVTSSLDSMVLGETQIIGQVKDAYFAAREATATGPVFNRLFQKALAVAKRVHSTTSLSEGNVSVPSVAAGLAGRVFHDLSSKDLVIIGAGETGELTVGAFRARGIRRIHVVNRTIENAQALAERCGGSAHGLDGLADVLPRGDIVIACIRSEGPVIGPDHLRAALHARRQEPMFLIDIAVPRIVDPAANRIENVYLYDMDDLEALVRENVLVREREVAQCEPLVEEETQAFLKDLTPPDVAALIALLRDRFTAMTREELERALGPDNGLSADQRAEVARRVANKFLHAPSEALRGGGLDGQSHKTAELIRKLFGIKD